MKHILKLFSITVLIIFIGAVPALANHRTSSYWQSQWEGSREGSSGYSEEDTRRWRESSATREAINNLDETRVDEIPIPILFGVALSDISSNFGDPRNGGARSHEGLDMLAPEGTPIVSPTEAVVIRVGTGSSAGKYVYTANPGGETFVYMHLADFAPGISSGDELDVGDAIGFVGDTGNASGGPAHLHFEIRDGGATDPFPRIEEEFDLDEKIEFIEEILDDVSDEEELAEFLVAEFPNDFIRARSAGIDLPREIEDALSEVSIATLLPNNVSDPRDLTIGSQGSAVVALQTFLISENSGSAAAQLASAGATGYFGTITQRALAEYQARVGISPASGYYGPLTRSYIENQDGLSVRETETTPVISTTDVSGIPQTNLTLGSRGEAVVWLQTFLIEKNSGVAASNLIEAGATGYFGTITQAALAEYQAARGVSPAVGHYGPLTRSAIATEL